VLLSAAFLAGAINALAGGGTLVTFPTLLWLGVDPIVANATNTVALWPGSLAALIGLRSELGVVRRWAVWLGVPSVAGAAVGAALLLRTPSSTFAAIVPYLILFATGLFALQGALARRLRHAPGTARRGQGQAPPTGVERNKDDEASPELGWALVVAFQFAVAIYGGYFGAGIGIMMLAGLGLFGLTNVHRMVGLRNFCGTLINAVAAALFIARGTVDWPYALIMTGGQIVGGYGGARLVRRLGATAVRWTVVAIGTGMGIGLLLFK